MDKINYSKCPLKKRPIYIINEEIEEEIEEGPIDLSVQKWHNKLKHNNPQVYKEPSQFAINYSTKLPTIKEENYLNNYDYEKLQNISTQYIDPDPYQRRISIENNENQQDQFKHVEYNHEDYQNNNERNFNNNFIKNDFDYNKQQYYNNNLRIKSFPANNSQYIMENYEPEDLTTFGNDKNILTERIVNVKNEKYPRKELRDKTNNDLYYKCNICNKCYSTNTGLMKHQQCHANRHPLEKIDNLELNRNTENSNNILNNNSQKLINLQRFQCKDCNKSYSTFSGLTKHQQFHCPNSEQNQVKKIFSCKNCDKVYVSLGALKMHIRTHTLPCKCPLCGKAFSRPWLLQGHIRTHTGEKPFSCQHCNRAFADRSNLRAHLQTHSDVKKYSCTSCTKTFSRMSLLAKHIQGGCQSGIININEECSQNGTYPESDYHHRGGSDESFYESKHNPSVIVQNNFYGNSENNGQQFPNDGYTNENF